MYGDGGEATMTADRPGDKMPAQDEEEKPSEQKTALIDSSICPGMEVGDEMVVKIIGIHDKEYEVAYSEEPDKEKGGDGEGEAPTAKGEGNPGGGMSSMYE